MRFLALTIRFSICVGMIVGGAWMMLQPGFAITSCGLFLCGLGTVCLLDVIN